MRMMQRAGRPEAPIYDITLQADAPFAQAANDACLVEAAEETLRWAGLGRAELTIVITDDESQRTLNRNYRGVDAPTDVLSFAAQEEDEGAPSPANLPADLAAALDAYLGDIVIAFPYAERQAERYQNHLAAELRMLTVHGVLHLLGHDHATTSEATAMWHAQRAILDRWDDPDTSQRVYADGPS